MSAQPRPPPSAFHVTDIRLQSSRKGFKLAAEVLINEVSQDLHWERGEDLHLTAGFPNPITLSPSQRLTIRVKLFRIGLILLSKRKVQDIHITAEQLSVVFKDGERNQREWQKSYDEGKLVISVGLVLGQPTSVWTSVRRVGTDSVISLEQPLSDGPSSIHDDDLRPTTDHILHNCPRFRILVIGKTGVGKSSLINSAFGVTQASVSDVDPGKADINTEIHSTDNNRFVLHDSQGFEHGETANVEIVQKFIEDRSNMPDIKDKLHAVWLCFEIPRAGGRILETGVERFLTLKTNGKLGKMPIIAVFTKYDQLVARTRRTMDPKQLDNLNKEEIEEIVERKALQTRDQICTAPLENRVGKDVPHMTVSSTRGYEQTLSDLIKLTFDNVREHVAQEASIVSAIAQKVNPGVNIDGSIAVGRSRYWKGLASSTDFPGKTLEKCLKVIHTDIVTVWSFKDPHKHLHSKEFKALMTHIVDEMHDKNVPSPIKGLTVSLSMMGTIAGIVSALSGPAAPIVIPIMAGLVVAKWVYDVYEKSLIVVKRLMAYIIDLTLILQNLFWLMSLSTSSASDLVVSRRLVKFAIRAYQISEVKDEVHAEIEKYVKATFLQHAVRDNTLAKVIELIDRNRITSAEMFRLRGGIGKFDADGDDEPWDAVF